MNLIKMYDSSNNLVLCDEQEKKAYIVNKGGTLGLKITKYDTIKQLAKDHNVFMFYEEHDAAQNYQINQDEALFKFKEIMKKYQNEVSDILDKIATANELIEKYKKK